MTGLLFLFRSFLVPGLLFLIASIPWLPTIGIAKVMSGSMKQEKKAAKTIETYLITVAVRLAKCIRMDEYKRSRVHSMLGASGMSLTPEVYQAYAFMKAGAILLGVIPCAFLLPLLSPAAVILFLLAYSKESRRADERLKAKRDEIEGELPWLVAAIEQGLKTSRNVIGMLERFKKDTGAALTGEPDILLVSMRSFNYEVALTRLEARLNPLILSDVVQGLIGVLRGDDDPVYFQMLAHDSKQLELQRLKVQAQKVPPKIRVFSFAMLMCFLLTYLVIIVYVAITSLSGMFQERRETMRLKEWIEGHPQSSLDMVVPGGYIFLVPKQTKKLSEGKDMKAHPGISGYDITVSVEELLAQNVVNVKWDGVVCHMPTGYMQKREPEPLTPGQRVVMCQKN